MTSDAKTEGVLALLTRAGALRQEGRLDSAETLCRQALQHDKRSPDAWAMLGALRMQRGDPREATRSLAAALDLLQWQHAPLRRNLAIVISALAMGDGAMLGISDRGRAYRRFLAARVAVRSDEPLVSIVLPHDKRVNAFEQSLASVFQQTYRHIELVIVDEQESAQIKDTLSSFLADAHFPIRRVVCGGPDWQAAINAGAEKASGEYIQPLHAGDTLSSDRIATMAVAVAHRDLDFGFGGARMVDASGVTVDELAYLGAFDARCMQSGINWFEATGFCFLNGNPVVTAGNLFVRREFYLRIGGLASMKFHAEWDFCLRALELSEVYVDLEPTYFLPRPDPLTADQDAVRVREGIAMLRHHVERALNQEYANPWAASYAAWGPVFVAKIFTTPVGDLVSASRMRELAGDMLALSR